jgi:hypothetical protein
VQRQRLQLGSGGSEILTLLRSAACKTILASKP